MLETERLILRRFSYDDAELILQLLNEPSFIRNIGDKGVRTIADAHQYMRTGPVASYERFGFGLYLVELKETGASMGYLDYSDRDDALSGGVKMIPINTPKGTFRVWTKRVGNNPKIKVLLLHGGQTLPMSISK